MTIDEARKLADELEAKRKSADPKEMLSSAVKLEANWSLVARCAGRDVFVVVNDEIDRDHLIGTLGGDADFFAHAANQTAAIVAAIRELCAEVERLRNPCPGDIESQAAGWVAVWMALESIGLLSFFRWIECGRDRAVGFVEHVGAELTRLRRVEAAAKAFIDGGEYCSGDGAICNAVNTLRAALAEAGR
mgnify:CR=1 FL=1